MKKRTYWIIGIAVAASIAAFLAFRFISSWAGLILAMVVMIAALVFLLARKSTSAQQKEIDELRKTVKDLSRELSEKTHSCFNVVDLSPIMHISVLNVDTSFVRPYVREEGKMTFQGALRADLRVEYGIRMEDVLYSFDEMTGNLRLANFRPGIISYSRKQLKWEFAKSFKTRKFLGIGFSDVCDKETEAFTASESERLRAELEEEIDTRNVSEFEWLAPLVTGQVTDIIRLMIGRESINVSIVDAPDASFLNLQQFKQQLALPE